MTTVSPVDDREAALINSEQYNHLNKTYTMTPPVDIPVCMGGNLRGLTSRKAAIAMNICSESDGQCPPEMSALIGWSSNPKVTVLYA